jgi:hypothetical protein
MQRIKDIWAQLERDNLASVGLAKIRYSDSSVSDIFLGVKFPERQRMNILRIPYELGKDYLFKYEFKGLRLDKVQDPSDSKYILLNLILVDNQFVDVFDTFVFDLISSVINELDVRTMLRNYSNRLNKWQSFFEKFKPQGLTPEEQRGLFGELFFMRRFLTSNPDFHSIIVAWVGPELNIRDFQFGKWSVEVKSTFGNNHQKIQVSSERQLDTANLDNLFLFHLSLEIRHKSGETLNQLVDDVTNMLNLEIRARSAFQDKLVEAGYLTTQKHLYQETGYYVRQATFYRVEGEFPRMEERDIPKGVGDVKYSIIVSQCSGFVRDESEVFRIINFS